MNVRQAINYQGRNWLASGGSTDVFYSKRQPSKAQYKKKVVLRS